jgi:hydroxyacylglutathione hydrolase
MQASMFGWRDVRDPLPIDRWIADGDRVALGKQSLDVIHTPGHTPGSVCFAIGEILFAGDTLFKGSVGRTDLPGGDSETLSRSIVTRLYTRDPHTLVIPGHGPTTQLGAEARTNPFVRA